MRQARVRQLTIAMSISLFSKRSLSFFCSPLVFFALNEEKKNRFPDPLCSTCDALASALSSAVPGSSSVNSALDADCRSCCTPDEDGTSATGASDDALLSAAASASAFDSSSPKASSAILEVCRSRLRAHRHVDEFVKHKISGFKGQVRLRDRYNSPPRIYFLDAKGKRMRGGEPVRVDHWKTEDIESFLKERLADVSGKEKKKGKGEGEDVDGVKR